jgi:adenine-specific DNA-methyltransferase
MVRWAAERGTPSQVVDPGAGSGRFLLAAAGAFPEAALVGIEMNPVCALLARANLAVLGLARRSQIIVDDYRRAQIARQGRTLFIGNPPYVRHHQIDRRWKNWLKRQANVLGFSASQLAGLHVHFYLRTTQIARPGDLGSFITAAEWLDVNYGQFVRSLLLYSLGLRQLVLLEPKAMPFDDAVTTGVITQFEVGERAESIEFKRADTVEDLARPNHSHRVSRARLASTQRWTHVFRKNRRPSKSLIELGEICRVSRGQVTGANKFWIAGLFSQGLPTSVLIPSITRAKELFETNGVLSDSSALKRVIDLPADLDGFSEDARRAIDRFLREGKKLGVDQGYIASHRKPWWSVRLHDPAPIIMTYMARRPPAFVRNFAKARHINIAHGLYPRCDLSPRCLDRLAEHLSKSTRLSDGRTYAGGLTKFEPREVERIPVPRPEELDQ